MNAPVRTFDAKPAVRESVPLLIGIMGASGAGKTFSALRLATGIQAVSGGDIFGIDTEARRMLHYADNFKFQHVQFDAPFGSLDYLAAIEQCVKAGAKVIVVDSLTHEHTGPGGYLQTHEAEVERMAGNDYAKRERVKMAGWIKPSALRQRMISSILQLNVNLIFCFRAKEKTKPVKGGGVQEMGFMPIAGEELLFEMTVNCLLMPKSGGIPSWRSDNVGEKFMMKLPKQFEAAFAAEKPLDEQLGRELATWARGGAPAPKAAKPADPPDDDMPQYTVEEYIGEWNEALEVADDAQRLLAEWNSDFQKRIRRATFGTDDTRLKSLITRVSDKAAELKKVPA